MKTYLKLSTVNLILPRFGGLSEVVIFLSHHSLHLVWCFGN